MSHFITSPDPLNGRYGKSVCQKECEIYRNIPTDCDLQEIELSTLTRCRKCLAGKLDKYVYLGRVKPIREVEGSGEHTYAPVESRWLPIP